jgi:hypothetical protein
MAEAHHEGGTVPGPACDGDRYSSGVIPQSASTGQWLDDAFLPMSLNGQPCQQQGGEECDGSLHGGGLSFHNPNQQSITGCEIRPVARGE